MMTPKKFPVVSSVSLTAILALVFSTLAFSQAKSPDEAQALVEEVKKQNLERQTAAKQTELNRLNEDLTKGRNESNDLKRSIEEMEISAMESTSHLDQLSAERTRLAQALEVANLRIDAEKLKLTGLKMLTNAQQKALATLSTRIEDTELRATVGAAELKLMTEGSDTADAGAKDGASKLRSQIAELRKKRSQGEKTIADANTAARDALQSAAAKLQLADAAAAKAKKRADELGLAEVIDASTQKGAITAPKAIPVR